MGRSVLLLVNRGKPDVLAALPEVRSLIAAHGRLVAELEADGLDVSSSDFGGTIECGLRAGRILFQEAASQDVYLFSQKVGRTVVKENVVCQLAFSGQWQLFG